MMGPAEQRLRKLALDAGVNYVPERGNTSAPVVMVGEAPGADEDRERKPFVGYSGQLLERMSGEAGFTTHDYWLTNTYAIRPPNNELDRLSEISIPQDAYIPVLMEQLHEHKPTIICALGATPLGALCPDTIERKTGAASITKWRGSLLRSPHCPWPHYVVPIAHPAFVLREWTERPVAVLCLAKAFEEFAFYRKTGALNPLPVRSFLTQPSAADVKDYLRECVGQKEPVSVDIETIYGRYLYTLGVSRSPNSAISFSFWDYEGSDGVAIWRLIDQLLSNQRAIGQNYISFDLHYLQSVGFDVRPEVADDTLVAHHVLWPEFEHKLQFLGLQYTREPYWKDEGKLWSLREGKGKLMRYNCLDAAATYEIWQAMQQDFQDRPQLWPFYKDYEIRLNHQLFHVENKGLLVNEARLKALREHVVREIDRKAEEIEKEVGRPVAAAAKCKCPKGACVCGVRNVWQMAHKMGIKQKDARSAIFNMGSGLQLMEELEKRGIKIPKKRGSKNNTVDEIALRKIAMNYNSEKLPMQIIDFRELAKMKGTYIDAKLLPSPDGPLLLSSYRVTGTKGGRRSSSENIFGFGTNGQNLPKHSELGGRFLECIVARSGKILIEGDQKGAEDWIVQGIIVDNGGSRRGLDELISGINRHRRLAGFLFSKPESEIDKSGIYYYAGKKTRHAANYSMQEDTMSMAMLKETGLNMPPAYCAWLLKRFHEYEPDIKGVYHKWVEEQLSDTRILRSPLGRERVWFDLRNGRSNAETYREAYSYVPQTTVGDNTGMCLVWLGDNGYRHAIVQDKHDAVCMEVDDNIDAIFDGMNAIEQGFDRIIRFPNGTELKIPVEYQLGYNQKDMKACPDQVTKAGLSDILTRLRSTHPALPTIISGQPLPL